MVRRLIVMFVLVTALQVLAFRYLHRDLFWIARAAAADAPVAGVRESATRVLARQKLARRYAEAIVRATDRDGLRDVHTAALARLAAEHPDDVDVQLRYADALRVEGRLDDAAAIFARVVEAR